MRIAERVKKLEETFMTKNRGFCKCPNQNAVFVIDPKQSPEEREAVERAAELSANPREPVCCGECGKELTRRPQTYVVEIVTPESVKETARQSIRS